MPAEHPVRSVDREDITEAIRRLGVRPGAVLLVHSSLSSLGRVDGGATAVIEALLEALGPDGLLVMPTFTRCRVDPSRAQPALPFDPAETGCRDRTGIIPDTFWRMEGVRRSLHPTHSLAALGPRAAEFVAGGERRTFDPRGPYGRLARWGAGSLFLGARMGINTVNHCAEDWMGLPFLTDERALVRTDGGVEEVEISSHPPGCRSFYGGGGEPARVMEDAGIVRRGELNGAELRLAAAREIVRICCQEEERQPGFLLCRGTPHEFCADGLARTLARRGEILARIAELRAGDWAPPEGWS